MTEQKQGRSKKRGLWLTLIVVAALLAAIFAPPLVSISRYKSQITRLISTSLGRPVRIASVEARLLPRPGFTLNDLTVEEDPQYGAEPVLHANKVAASISFFPLWRGRLEISSLSLDEASLNLVRVRPGEWNVDSLFRSATAGVRSQSGQSAVLRLPHVAATNSRINIKQGEVKTPFSLINTDFAIRESSHGSWSLSLRGQPARTDVVVDLADTGTVRLQGTVQDAPRLSQMPMHLNVVWKEAQLGQLSRLLVGSDPGWRGDLTGEAQYDGTAEAAQLKARLRAESVRRAEFTPAAPLDFDARCTASVHLVTRSYEKLSCDSPLGGGRLRLTGEHPAGSPLKLNVALDKIPAQALLAALRTVRSDFGKGLEAQGGLSGELTLDKSPLPAPPAKDKKKGQSAPAGIVGLSGELTLDNLKLSGAGLSAPVEIARVVLAPAPSVADQPLALVASVAIPAGAAAPLNVTARLTASGYALGLRGQATPARAREFARTGGMDVSRALEGLSGAALTIDLTTEGPWIPATESLPLADRTTGSVSFRNVSWKAPYLVNPLDITAATLHLSENGMHWEPVEFAYGPLKGSAVVDLPEACEQDADCQPRFRLEFAELNAATAQSAFLGARAKGAVLKELLARLRPASAPAWPQAEGVVHAALCTLGPLTLKDLTLRVSLDAEQAVIESLTAKTLGGSLQASGELRAPKNEREKPVYALEGEFKNLAAQAVGQLLGARFTGGPINASGKLELTGYTGDDLASSAKGSLRFEWKRGAISGVAQAPSALNRFALWSGEATIAQGQLLIPEALVGGEKRHLGAVIPLAERTKLSFNTAPAAAGKP